MSTYEKLFIQIPTCGIRRVLEEKRPCYCSPIDMCLCGSEQELLAAGLVVVAREREREYMIKQCIVIGQ